jgi:hypothetical protein
MSSCSTTRLREPYQLRSLSVLLEQGRTNAQGEGRRSPWSLSHLGLMVGEAMRSTVANCLRSGCELAACSPACSLGALAWAGRGDTPWLSESGRSDPALMMTSQGIVAVFVPKGSPGPRRHRALNREGARVIQQRLGIVGAGILGLAVAYRLQGRYTGVQRRGRGNGTRRSPPPNGPQQRCGSRRHLLRAGSMKSELCLRGGRLMREYSQARAWSTKSAANWSSLAGLM